MSSFNFGAFAGGVFITEWSGVATSSPLDTQGSNRLNPGSPVTATTAGNVSTAGSIAVGAVADFESKSGTATIAESSSWTDLINNGATSQNHHLLACYKTSPTTGATLSLAGSSSSMNLTVLGVSLAVFKPAPATSAALTGTITSSAKESDIVAGGKTIILTLTGDTWVASGATFDAQRQNIINGLDSAQAEAGGWDAVVKATQGVSGVVRTSATVVTITLDAFASYQITATETITATIPATALTGAAQIVATPTFTVGTVALASSLTDDFDDNSIDAAKWTSFNTPSETNSRFEVASSTSAIYKGVDSLNLLDIRSTEAFVQLVVAGDRTISSLEIYAPQVAQDATNKVFWLMPTGANIRPYKQVASVSTALGTTLAHTDGNLYKIRESAGTTYWDYSTDNGANWTNHYSEANPITLTATTISLIAGTYAGEASTTTIAFDNFNVTPTSGARKLAALGVG